MELRLFAKPGRDGQVFISMDSMIEFLRHSAATRKECVDHKLALLGLADFLEEERVKIKNQQATIAEVFSGASATQPVQHGGVERGKTTT